MKGMFGKMAMAMLGLAFVGQVCASELRRPLGPESPMIMIHADTWSEADPQKIIDLIPEDIKPYAVLVISLSIYHDSKAGKWLQNEYAETIITSWLRTAAENRVWAMIQPASGGTTHMPDYPLGTDLDTTIYGKLFREYPNFLGMNFAEQFWGYNNEDGSGTKDPLSVTWTERVNQWVNLINLCEKYGGAVAVSFTGAYYGSSLNSVAMIKRNSAFENVLKKHPEHFIMEEKFTMNYGFHEVESTSMGMWLSGYAGHYGIRFDDCGWVSTGSEKFPPSSGAIPFTEHIMLTGETVIDGPETIPTQSVHPLGNRPTSDGFTSRQWEFFPQYHNITLDVMRKILDGSFRIPTRKEVIDRTKIVIINNQASQWDDNIKYGAPKDLYDGLYLMDGDGQQLKHKSWFKKTGRYPAIPVVANLSDDLSKTFEVKINRGDIGTRWPNIGAKQNEFNKLFAEEYTGDIFASRVENTWVTYNPKKTGAKATGTIPFKYNKSEKLELNYSIYSMGIVKEFADSLQIYMTNYDNVNNTGLMTDEIKIYGSDKEPTYSFKDRANHAKSEISKSWKDGVLTLTVKHNGPLDLSIQTFGSKTGRETKITQAKITTPTQPSAYTGTLQYEGEHFDFKSVGGNVTNGIGRGVRNYEGMGYLNFGKDANAAARDTVNVLAAGVYKMDVRYSNGGADVKTVDLYVNGEKVKTLDFKGTGNESTFKVSSNEIQLKSGKNVVLFKANGAAPSNVVIDNFTLTSVQKIVVEPPKVSMNITAVENDPSSVHVVAEAQSALSTISHLDFIVNDSVIHSEWTYPYDFDWKSPSAGEYTMKVVVYDEEGNTASESKKFTVEGTNAVAKNRMIVGETCDYAFYDMNGNWIAKVRANSLQDAKNIMKMGKGKTGLFVVKTKNTKPQILQIK